MGKCITVAIAGLGSRGYDEYAQAQKQFPQKMKIVAVADIDPEKVQIAAKEFDIPKKHCYGSAEEMLEQKRLADVMFIATQDRQHVGQAIPALRKGYHLLLEKPISPALEECRELVEVAKECNRRVVVCHVLRYTPIYQKVKELLAGGEIGEIVSIMAAENVGWWHMAHSFVRGNWRNSNETSPMILQKCCHDMDLYMWLAGKTCESLSSYGSTYLFKEEKAPEGCAKRCLDCKIENCPFNAEDIYLNSNITGVRFGKKGWPGNVLVNGEVTEEKLIEALQTGPYGRCVYHCDNNVVDHQVVNLNMTDGTTMSFTMCGFSSSIARYAKFHGTKGELIVNMDSNVLDANEIVLRKFGPQVEETRIDVSTLSDNFSGHGGGDIKMVEEFLDVLSGEKRSKSICNIVESIHGESLLCSCGRRV